MELELLVGAGTKASFASVPAHVKSALTRRFKQDTARNSDGTNKALSPPADDDSAEGGVVEQGGAW